MIAGEFDLVFAVAFRLLDVDGGEGPVCSFWRADDATRGLVNEIVCSVKVTQKERFTGEI